MTDSGGPNADSWRMGGRGGKQRLIPDPNTGELRPYMRVSTFAKTLDDTYGLMAWKAWMAVKGAARDKALREAALHAQSTPRAVVDGLVDAGGGGVKRDRGKDRHALLAMALTGSQMPEMPPDARAELDKILRLIEGMGEIVAVEAPVVCDEWQLSGTADLILRSRPERRETGNGGSRSGGLPIVADFKTGGDYRLSAAIQLVAYARSRYWDFATETRGDKVAPTLPRLVMIHAPQDGTEPRLITLDPIKARAAADLAWQVRRARKEFAA